MNAAEQLALIRLHYWSEQATLASLLSRITYRQEITGSHRNREIRRIIATTQFESAREMATQLGVLAE